MATTAAAGHSGSKDFHQVQFAPRVLVALSSTDANVVGGVAGVAANIVGGGGAGGGGGIGIVSGSEEATSTTTIINSSNNNTNANANSNNNNNKNRIAQSMKNQLPVLKPDTLFNGTGIFTIYCFVKDFIGASGTSAVAIDNKIEQAMDLVKSHLMIAVREEVEVLKEKISELMDKINQLEVENTILKANMSQETLHQLQMQAQLQIAGGVGSGNMITAPPPTSQQSQQQQQQQQVPTTQQQQQQQQATPQAANTTANNSTNGPLS